MFERLMFRKVELWVVGLICVAAFVGMTLVSAIARKTADTAEGNKQFGLVGEAALALSMAPEELMRTGRVLISGASIPDMIRYLRNEEKLIAEETPGIAGKAGFAFSYPAGTRADAGYLLLSRYNGDDERSYVELVDLNAQKVLHRWAPDIDAIWARSHLQSHFVNLAQDKHLRRYIMTHPYVTEDGGLVFKSQSPLVKIDACSRLVWINDEDVFHHSTERDDSGMFWVATMQEPVTIKAVPKKFHDDSIAMGTPDGKLLMNRSVSQILIDNRLAHLLFWGDGVFPDPIHLNDIEPVRKDGPYWRKGDLFLSLRSPSTVMLYRPSTNKVIWHKTGPWRNQHDVDILDDHRISIFNNNSRQEQVQEYVAFRTAEVNIYDFATGEVTSPWRGALERLDVWAGEQSLAEVLPNDELFVEEQPHGRLIRLTLEGDVVWEFVNRAKMGRVFNLGWSRFLDTATGSRLAETLARVDCGGT